MVFCSVLSITANGAASSGVRERLPTASLLPRYPRSPSHAGSCVWAASASLCRSALVGRHGRHDCHLTLCLKPTTPLQQREVRNVACIRSTLEQSSVVFMPSPFPSHTSPSLQGLVAVFCSLPAQLPAWTSADLSPALPLLPPLSPPNLLLPHLLHLYTLHSQCGPAPAAVDGPPPLPHSLLPPFHPPRHCREQLQPLRALNHYSFLTNHIAINDRIARH